MKPRYRLRIKPAVTPSSKSEAIVTRKEINERNKQLEAAVSWCRERGVRGHTAIKSGQFPMIKHRETINRRLDRKIVTGQEKQYCSILTVEEENSLVSYIKNKNRALQGINRSDVTKLIMNVLKIRSYTNKRMKGGRKYIPL